MVIMNDDTFEEVVKFRLSRLSVYIVLSISFLFMIGLAVAVLVFTPLKYYLPGTTVNSGYRRELQTLKMRTDSMEQVLKYKDAYMEGIKKVLGADAVTKDTTALKIPKTPFSND